MKHQIDFFELLFLAEVCIPPRPIAKTMFFERLCNSIFYQLTKDERKSMFNFLKDKMNDDDLCRYFLARFNPDNQYRVTVNTGESFECCLCDDGYHTKQFTTVRDDVIFIIEKI